MYYTAAQHNLKIQYCMRDAANFHWSDYFHNPPETASSISGLPKFTRVDPYAAKIMSERDELNLMWKLHLLVVQFLYILIVA